MSKIQTTKIPLTLALITFAVRMFVSVDSTIAQSTAFTYTGHLNNNGTPVNGAYDLRFTLYDASDGGGVVAGPLPVSPVNVTNGLFSVRVDFGAGVFSGLPRWLNLEVRPAGGGGFMPLAPRQEVTSSPYSIRAQTAGSVANSSVVANQLNTGGVAPAPGQFLSYNGGNLVWSDPAVAAGSLWSLNHADTYYNAGNVGIGTNSPTPGVRLEVNGNVRVHPDGGGGEFVQIGTPNGETGMSISGANRADVRFDGSALKLLAGLGPGAMPSQNGIAIRTSGYVGIGTEVPDERLTVGGASAADTKIQVDAGGDTYAALRVTNSAGSWLWQVTPSNDLPGGRMRLTDETTGNEWLSINHSGNVGIGTSAPAHRLSLIGGPSWTANLWSGALELGNASAIGWRADAGGQSFGIGQSTGGLYVFRTASDPGTTGSPATYDVHVTDNGNLTQTRDKGGLVKAMAYIDSHGTIVRCYNGITGESNVQASGITSIESADGVFNITFPFDVNDRFLSVTPHYGSGGRTPNNIGADFTFQDNDPKRVNVFTYDANGGEDTYGVAFMIIVY